MVDCVYPLVHEDIRRGLSGGGGQSATMDEQHRPGIRAVSRRAVLCWPAGLAAADGAGYCHRVGLELAALADRGRDFPRDFRVLLHHSVHQYQRSGDRYGLQPGVLVGAAGRAPRQPASVLLPADHHAVLRISAGDWQRAGHVWRTGDLLALPPQNV